MFNKSNPFAWVRFDWARLGLIVEVRIHLIEKINNELASMCRNDLLAQVLIWFCFQPSPMEVDDAGKFACIFNILNHFFKKLWFILTVNTSNHEWPRVDTSDHEWTQWPRVRIHQNIILTSYSRAGDYYAPLSIYYYVTANKPFPATAICKCE